MFFLLIANGCGPKVLGSIDKELKAVGEGNLIQCCDQHDICYGTCTPGQDQKYCDNQFNQCLTTQCSNTYPNTKTLSLKLKSDACKASAKTMYTLVKDFGKLFYTGCTTKKNILSKLFKS